MPLRDSLEDTDTYKKVLLHRKDCPKWGKEFCLGCFGGGLTTFVLNLTDELAERR